LDGLFFTGSSQTGLALHRQFSDHPEKMLALEMGGNNPLVVLNPRDKKAAAYTCIQSAYLTSGQRCTCARRLLVPQGPEGDAFLTELGHMISKIHVAHHSARPEPFMGPLITLNAADHVLAAYEKLVRQGATIMVPMKRLKENTALLSPALIEVTAIKNREDREIFGPLLQVIRVKDFDAALLEANNTAYGLSAGILCDDREDFEKFYAEIRAGIVNWNRQTTGAIGLAPFGGVGLSGNHRPSAYFAADYCAYPVATTEVEELKMPEKLLPGINL
jgi:succinylglutamic semialdehyde dehydrogenase